MEITLAMGTCRRTGYSTLKCSAFCLQRNATGGGKQRPQLTWDVQRNSALGDGLFSMEHFKCQLRLTSAAKCGEGRDREGSVHHIFSCRQFFFWGNYHIASHQIAICMLCCNIRPPGLIPTVDAVTAAAYKCILISSLHVLSSTCLLV